MSKKENKLLLVLTIFLIMCLSVISILYTALLVVVVSNVVKFCSFVMICMFFLIKYIMIYGLTLNIFKERSVNFRIVRKGDDFTIYANGDRVG